MKFKRGRIEYELDYIPKCNQCGNDLILKERKNKKTKENYYQIISCSVCHEKLTKTEKIKAYFPFDLSEYIIKKNHFNLKTNNICRVDYWINKGYTEAEAKSIISEKQKERQKKKKNFKTKTKQDYLNEGYSEEQCRLIKPFPNMIEYWIKKGFTEDEAKIKISEIQQKRSNKRTYKDDRYPNQIKYWVNRGYSLEDSKHLVSESQKKFSLDICINKFGEKEGTIIFKNRQKKWGESYKKSNYSKISQELFWAVYKKLKNISDGDIFFATFDKGKRAEDGKNKEYILPLDKSFIRPDFFIKSKRKIIEFDGYYFHNSKPENVKRENERDEKIIRNEYLVLHIFEKNYNNDKEGTINECIKFLNE